MQLPQPTRLHVAIPMLSVGEMPAIEEGRACEAELHGGFDVACRIHARVLDEGREVLTRGLKQGAVLGARYLRDHALLDRPRGGRSEFDVPVSVHFVAKDAHPPHEGVNVQLVAHALSAPVLGWQRRRRPSVHDLGERRGRCRLGGEAGIGLLFPAIVISVAALRILPLPRGDGSNRGTYERQQEEWPHGTSRVDLMKPSPTRCGGVWGTVRLFLGHRGAEMRHGGGGTWLGSLPPKNPARRHRGGNPPTAQRAGSGIAGPQLSGDRHHYAKRH